MASITTEREDLFPPGTSVAAYRGTGRSRVTSGPPAGTAVTTATVPSDGRVTHSGLEGETSYLLYANVGGEDRYLNVATPAPPTYRDFDLTGIDDGDALGYDEATNTITSLGPVETKAQATIVPAYDVDGNIESLTVDGAETTYEYDADGNVETINHADGRVETLSYTDGVYSGSVIA